MIRIVDTAQAPASEVQAALIRPRIDSAKMFDIVSPIVRDVQSLGDDAVRSFTAKFDGVTLDDVVVDPLTLPDQALPSDVQAAFDVAYDNIRRFH